MNSAVHLGKRTAIQTLVCTKYETKALMGLNLFAKKKKKNWCCQKTYLKIFKKNQGMML